MPISSIYLGVKNMQNYFLNKDFQIKLKFNFQFGTPNLITPKFYDIFILIVHSLINFTGKLLGSYLDK